MQNNTFDEIAERHVELGGEPLKDFQQTALDPNAGLSAADSFHGRLLPCYLASGQLPRIGAMFGAVAAC